MFSRRDIFELAIQIEKNGEKICRQALKQNIDSSLRKLILWMADEEQKHIKWLQELITAADPLGGDTQLEKVNRGLLKDILGKQGFSLADADFVKIKGINALLNVFIEFENDTILFYDLIRSVDNDPKTLKFLDGIVSEEKNHIKKLKAYAEKLVEQNESSY